MPRRSVAPPANGKKRERGVRRWRKWKKRRDRAKKVGEIKWARLVRGEQTTWKRTLSAQGANFLDSNGGNEKTERAKNKVIDQEAVFVGGQINNGRGFEFWREARGSSFLREG